MRRTSIIASSLIASAAAFLGGVGPAFATRVTPVADPGSTAHAVAHSGGLAVWQTSLIVVSTLVVVAAVATLALRIGSRRSTLRAAIR